ncbi:RNA polymerase subunit sigma-70 [Streptacidiphilus jiangxiensis]|uniref:RNA polymerase sigma-70 factor, ECF subfamily n=1 Tax=Streptacidiphilus jiangxiensis TaxID=235985 RepID=A0A1H7TAN7_STRJI|nr:RNA polymerase subunit sigma-70 [Streptacidiphilus jiangxiensis]SEL81930.1 RNA polymerase sigma-70 factor, ECF subfamily [Streptacidiphilus jiangxiensis]
MTTLGQGTPAAQGTQSVGLGVPAGGWDALHARHQHELLGYCYRMLGSPFDAEEAVQETWLRAWRGRGEFAGRASVRVWLFRIATNVCLDLLRQRPRRERPVDVTAAGDPLSPRGAAEEERWLLPAPDRWLLPADPDPAHAAVLRESVRLAFVAALHRLPPTQRATLLARDILRLSAQETAALLEVTVPAANGLLRRARHSLAATAPTDAEGNSDGDGDGGPRRDELSELSKRQRALLDRYITAFERHDIPALLALLHDDATLSMPPHALWLAGRADIGRWFLRDPNPCLGSRALPIRANGTPGLAILHHDGQGPAGWRPFAVQLLTVREDRIAALDTFLDPRLVALLTSEAGAPDRLPW